MSLFLQSAFFDRKIEIAMSIFFALPILFISNHTFSDKFEFWALMPIFFIISYIAKRNQTAYYLSGVLPIIWAIIINFLDNSLHFLLHSWYWGACIIAFICFLSDGFERENQSFISNAFSKLQSVFIALFITILAGIAVVIIFSTVKYLFDFYSLNALIDKVASFFTFGVFPLLFLLFDAKNKERELHQISKSVINLILTPTLIIYTALLYVYIANIIFISGLPRGNVATIVLIYLVVGAILFSLQFIINQPKWVKFYRYFPMLATAPIVLLWVGIYERVSSYGFTVFRIYLISISLTFTIFYIIMATKRLFSYRFLALIAIAFAFISCFLINPTQISLKSQTARLYDTFKRLNLTDENGDVKSDLTAKKLKNMLKDDEYYQIYHLSYAIESLDRDFTLKNNERLIADITHRQYAQVRHMNIYADEQIIDLDGFSQAIVLDIDCDIRRDCDERLRPYYVPNIDFNEHFKSVFKKHGFDLMKAYYESDLKGIKEDLTEINLAQGKLFLRWIRFAYDPNDGWEVERVGTKIYLTR